ncbi:MAG TPA: flavin reductase family protein [Solirubrobacteraceae bacterium]|nr:flavin reductase family protein [Solirubrobacteraceae bacterium]
MSASQQEMRAVMGHFATGVCVISARRPDGSPVATTVNAVSSVSLRPPLLLVCLAHDSHTLAALRGGARFAVNVLAAHQREHSIRFAAKGEHAKAHEVQFGEHELEVPYLPGALATIACRVSQIHPAGDHVIVIGEALASSSAERALAPLLFFRGSYSQLAHARPAAHLAAPVGAPAPPASAQVGPERASERSRAPTRRRLAVLERIG